jgi:hypothetical protein
MIKNYSEIFEELIGQYLRDTIIYKYNSRKVSHEYTPFRHDLNINTEKVLAQYMRKYIFLYAYSEDEVLKAYNRGRLANLEVAAERALRERLPNRSGVTNGLYSELLLDLLITMFAGNANKLATRAIYRQRTDREEIKGFDGLHIVADNNIKQIWLGQAKMGSKYYCTSSIQDDLDNKANMLYTSSELYFIADKEEKAVREALDLLEKINDISFECDASELEIDERAKKLRNFFVDEKIKIVLPCLLAYEAPSVYKDDLEVDNKITSELRKMIKKFDSKFKSLMDNVEYEVLLWFIPIRNLNDIRSNMGV